jgi:predicted aspartyl protease
MKKFLNTVKKFLIWTVVLVLVTGSVAWYNGYKPKFIQEYFTYSNDTARVEKARYTEKPDTLKPEILMPSKSISQKIPIQINQDGTVSMRVEVNGYPMKFIIDSGCNTLSIGYVQYLFLKSQCDSIPSLEKKETVLANGVTSRVGSTVIDSVKIGSIVIKNVPCVVIMPDSLNLYPAYPLLLGMSSIYKSTKKMTINYEEKILELESE